MQTRPTPWYTASHSTDSRWTWPQLALQNKTEWAIPCHRRHPDKAHHSPPASNTGLLAAWKQRLRNTSRARSCTCLVCRAWLSSRSTSGAAVVLVTICWPSVNHVTFTSRLNQACARERAADRCLVWLFFRGLRVEKCCRKLFWNKNRLLLQKVAEHCIRPYGAC